MILASLRSLGGQFCAALVLTLGLTATSPAQAEDGEISIAVVTFLSGPAAAHFGVPAREGAETTIDALNAGAFPAPYNTPGIGGMEIVPIFVDEAGGATKQVAEFRNLVQRRNVDIIMGYISSGDCLAIPQVAEELKQFTILVDCGTPRVFEEASYQYVFRTGPHAAMDNVAIARYLLDRKPDVKTIAGLNQNYAWGQDSWNDFQGSMEVLKPGIEVVDVQFPKLFAGQFGAEISALLSRRPDVIHSSFWGADLEALILQGGGRGLFERSQVVLSAGEHVLHLIGDRMPDGTFLGARGPHGPFAPESEMNTWFHNTYTERWGHVPNQGAYKYTMALLGLKTAYAKAEAVAGSAPTPEQVMQALTYLEWDSPSGMVKMALADGHQAIQANAIGTSRYDEAEGRIVVDDVVYYNAECVNPPPGIKAIDWIRQGFPDAKCN